VKVVYLNRLPEDFVKEVKIRLATKKPSDGAKLLLVADGISVEAVYDSRRNSYILDWEKILHYGEQYETDC
jgi:hypothetical protein